VSTHKTHLMQKLGVHNAAELVRYAIRHGLSDAAQP
jgi:DNA-binding NarL/FixJ family response regulator